jgi:hypothetical protein
MHLIIENRWNRVAPGELVQLRLTFIGFLLCWSSEFRQLGN